MKHYIIVFTFNNFLIISINSLRELEGGPPTSFILPSRTINIYSNFRPHLLNYKLATFKIAYRFSWWANIYAFLRDNFLFTFAHLHIHECSAKFKQNISFQINTYIYYCFLTSCTRFIKSLVKLAKNRIWLSPSKR